LEYLFRYLLVGKRGLRGALDKGLCELLDRGIYIRPVIYIISRLDKVSKWLLINSNYKYFRVNLGYKI
jgi:hypothetical protein